MEFYAMRNLFIKYAGCRRSEFHAAIDLAGHVLFTARAIRSEILNFYSAVNLMRLKILTRREICGIFGIYQIKF